MYPNMQRVDGGGGISWENRNGKYHLMRRLHLRLYSTNSHILRSANQKLRKGFCKIQRFLLKFRTFAIAWKTRFTHKTWKPTLF